MSAAPTLRLMSVEDYLHGELTSSVRHEFLGGMVYAMTGARVVHNRIAGNVFASLHRQLIDHRCQPFGPDMKVRLRHGEQWRFYYPDASVVCRSNPPGDLFQDEPSVIVEVLSESTRRTDEGEKKDAYLNIPSLAAYLLIEPDSPAVVVFRRRGASVERDVVQGLDGVIRLPEIDCELALAEIYRRVEFSKTVGDGVD